MGYEQIKSTDKIKTVPFNALQPVNTGITSTVRDVAMENKIWFGYVLHENGAAVAWVQVFYRPASEVTLGTTAPDFTITLSAADSVAYDFRRPIELLSGMSVAGTTTETGSTTAGAAITGQFFVF